MKIIFSEECLRYSCPGHVESLERVRDAYKFLKEKGYEFLKPKAAEEKDILRVHSKELFDEVKYEKFSETGDNPKYKNIFYYASLSTGAVIMAMNTCFEKNENFCFSLMRPPGHHATRDEIGGFCYFNNIAIAVAKYLDENKNKKVAILDIDVHHGNGTQDIFLENVNVVYVSLHRYGFLFPFYPGTGRYNEENCFNYPLTEKTKEKDYLEELGKALERIKEFNPDLIAVSAGFDTYKNDPLAGLELEIESYEKIGKMIKNLNLPCFSVLEGGYSSKLGECIWSYLKGIE